MLLLTCASIYKYFRQKCSQLPGRSERGSAVGSYIHVERDVQKRERGNDIHDGYITQQLPVGTLNFINIYIFPHCTC